LINGVISKEKGWGANSLGLSLFKLNSMNL